MNLRQLHLSTLILTIAMGFDATALTVSKCTEELNQCGPRIDARMAASKIACEARRASYRCDKIFAESTAAEKALFFSCTNPRDLCEQSASNQGGRLYACGTGVAHGVFIDPVLGIYHLSSAVWAAARGRGDLPEVFERCPEDLESKKILMGALRPAEMTDAAMTKLPCADVKTFVRTKAEVILARLEQRRQTEMATRGTENLDVYALSLTEAETQALDYDRKHTGLLGKANCFRPDEAVRILCREAASSVLSTTGTYALGATGARLIRAFEGAVARSVPSVRGVAVSESKGTTSRGTTPADEIRSPRPIIESIVPSPKDVYAIDVGTGSPKNVRFLEVDSWGLPEHFKGKTFDLVMTVDNREQAHAIFTKILKAGPKEWTEHGTPPLVEDMVSFNLPDRLHAYVRTPTSGREVGAQAKELVISMDTAGNGPAEAAHLLKALNGVGLRRNPNALQTMELNSLGARSEWAKYSFAPWAKTLTNEESVAFQRLGGYEYREINARLRAPDGRPRPELDATIKAADQAIARGKVNRDVEVYRADSSPELHELWDKMSTRSATGAPVPLKPDPGFSYTSVNREVAEWWNHAELKKKGVLLEIEVPANTPAAYMDTAMHDHGYMEMLFPRNSKLEAVSARRDEAGQKILRVKLKP